MKRKEGIRIIFENEVNKPRFSMARLFSTLADSGIFDGVLQSHREYLGRGVADHVFKGIIRSIFLIELAQEPKIETTQYRVRWTEQLDPSDPRYASYEECLRILEQMMLDLVKELKNQSNQELLKLMCKVKHPVSYEIPIDYKERGAKARIHCLGNISWFFGSLLKRVVKLREFLLDKKLNPYAPILSGIYNKKIKIKIYLTDRSLTGDYKTNREKRWEAHPASVQFAFRRTCMEVELALVSQLCHFAGFPADLRSKIENLGFTSATHEVFRCPVTQEPLSFAEFESEVKEPEHGKSNFQIGHMNPLKAASRDPHSGHTAQNISWISSDGNRIQGHLSIAETRALIRRIYENYREFGIE